MSRWKELTSSPCRDKLCGICEKFAINIDIRNKFAEWFETVGWNIPPEDVQTANHRLVCLSGMIDMLRAEAPDMIVQMRLTDYKKKFDSCYSGQPQKFVASIKSLLDEECQLYNDYQRSLESQRQQLLQQQMQQQQQANIADNDIGNLVAFLKQSVMETEESVRKFKGDTEEFILSFNHYANIETSFNESASTAEKNKLQKDMDAQKQTIKPLANQITQDNQMIFQNIGVLLGYMDKLLKFITVQKVEWCSFQQKSLSGHMPPEQSIETLQKLFQDAAELFLKIRGVTDYFRQIVESYFHNDPNKAEQINVMVQKIDILIVNLIQCSFIVDTQPKQVLKTMTKFQASARLLVGKSYPLANNPTVKVSILSVKQCREYMKEKSLDDIGVCGEIANDKCVMEYNPERGTLIAEFKNLQLKKIKRQDRKNQESVLEAKSALVFSTNINNIEIKCMTVPVVVVVHGNQSTISEATIIWDNMFSAPDRIPFDVPEEVPWQDMKVALSAKWKSMAELELEEEALEYLRNKIFSTDDTSDRSMVPWMLFNKDQIQNRNFTFWEWFWGAIELVKKHVKEHWKDRSLILASRHSAQRKLLEKQPGTFLIRFSDGELGAVTIAWRCTNNGQDDVCFLQPWTAKDLNMRSLADRIMDLQELTHIYPDVKKEQVFTRYTGKEIASRMDESYVSAELFTKIRNTGNFLSSNPVSPAPSDHQNSEEFYRGSWPNFQQDLQDFGTFSQFQHYGIGQIQSMGMPMNFPMTPNMTPTNAMTSQMSPMASQMSPMTPHMSPMSSQMSPSQNAMSPLGQANLMQQ